MAKKVLIADDEPNIVTALEFLLRRRGYDVRVAIDGEAALALVESYAPDVVLLDVMMPVKSGYEVCRACASAPSGRTSRSSCSRPNANPVRRVKGIETYLLNWTNDDEAMRVAARENKISLKKMREMHRQMDTLGMILNDLSRDSKRNDSIKLANYIQQSMVTTLNNESSYKRIDLGVKQALFYVLFGASMPSVLVEVSFISNPQEEQLLSDESYRMQIAKAIAKGLNTYTDSTPAIQKVAGL